MDSLAPQTRPIVFACSGCSDLAQIGNDIAVTLDKHGLAEMFCVTGLAANVKVIIDAAKSGRAIIAIDGCGLGCAEQCLTERGIAIDKYVRLSELSIGDTCATKITFLDSARLMQLVYRELGFAPPDPALAKPLPSAEKPLPATPKR